MWFSDTSLVKPHVGSLVFVRTFTRLLHEQRKVGIVLTFKVKV